MSAAILELFAVGGIVRDELLGIRSKDVDFTAVIPGASGILDLDEGFDHMRSVLVGAGLEIFVETPEFLTIRAQVPRLHPLARFGSTTADFVLARWDSPASDGRRPAFVKVGELRDDLARRDFTVNAMARFAGGFVSARDGGNFVEADPANDRVIDLHGGMEDLESMTLRFVGDPVARIMEDALRVMRALRFVVTKGFTLDEGTDLAIRNPAAAAMLARISEERRAEELGRMFDFDTVATLALIRDLPDHLVEAMFAGRVRLTSTLRK